MTAIALPSRLLTLPAWDGEEPLRFERLLSGQSGCAPGSGRWRIIELVSSSGRPFEARLAWTAGSGGNLRAQVTVARGTRIGLFARSITVEVANLSEGDNKVTGIVADSASFVQTHNQYEVRGANDNDLPYSAPLEIPPFATRLSIHTTDDPSDLPGWRVNVYDGQNTLRTTLTLAQQPDTGIEVGGAGRITLSTSGQVAAWRAVFTLSL